MKVSYAGKFFFGIFLPCIVFSLVALTGCAGKPVSATTSAKIKIEKEMLVARDVGRGGGIFSIRWCGNNGLVYRIYDTGDVEMLDFQTGKRMPINVGPHDTLLNCGPDGKKLFYLLFDGGRLDERIEEPTIELAPRIFGWHWRTEDMYMYDTLTGEKTIIASIRSAGSYDAISPDGTKILLGEKHRLASKTGAPELESVWFAEKWRATNMTWFPDSSGVLGYGTGEMDKICIEMLGEDGWARCFDMKDTTDEPRVDRENRVYFLYVEFDIMTELERNFLYRCDLRDRELSCERIIKDHNVMPTYGFLPDGDIIFQDYDYDDAPIDCIRRITPGQEAARCEISQRYGDQVYDDVGLIGVSPDSRWLVFDRSNWRGWKEIEIPYAESLWQGQIDLFVIDLKEK